jgi:hypothetical protein
MVSKRFRVPSCVSGGIGWWSNWCWLCVEVGMGVCGGCGHTVGFLVKALQVFISLPISLFSCCKFHQFIPFFLSTSRLVVFTLFCSRSPRTHMHMIGLVGCVMEQNAARNYFFTFKITRCSEGGKFFHFSGKRTDL